MATTRRTASLNTLVANTPQVGQPEQVVNQQLPPVQENEQEAGGQTNIQLQAEDAPPENAPQENQAVEPQQSRDNQAPQQDNQHDQTPEAPRPVEEFYRQIGRFILTIKDLFPVVHFNAEGLLQTFQEHGLNCVSGQHLVQDASLTNVSGQDSVLEFVSQNIQSLDKIVEYCTMLAKGQASPDRFESTVLSDLCSSLSKFGNYPMNPTPRPRFVLGFTNFEVDQVSNEAADLVRRNEKQKYYEFAHVYKTVSWLFDTGCELLMHLQVPSLPQEQFTSLALITASTWHNVSMQLKRLVEIEQLGSDDAVIRQLAQLKYKRKSSVLYKGKEAVDIENTAANIVTKQVSERLKKQGSSSNYPINFYRRGRARFNNVSRGFYQPRGRGRFSHSYAGRSIHFSQGQSGPATVQHRANHSSDQNRIN